jgi:transposase
MFRKSQSHIFQVDRITIYNWFDRWESRRLAGLYDRAGKGRKPIFHQEQREQIRQWIKLYPKNLNKVIALIQQEFAIQASKSTIKRLLKICQMTWRRIRRKLTSPIRDFSEHSCVFPANVS